MATFTGYLGQSSTYDQSAVNPAIGGRDVPVWNEGYLSSEGIFGAFTNTQPGIAAPANTHAGYITEQYAFLHWYNRIHIQYTNLNLGNVVGDQEIEFWILNTFLIPQTLDAVNETGVEGLELIQPDTPPYDFAPFEEKFYTLTIDTSGPPTIDAEFEFEFPGFRNLTLNVVGVRVVGWYWEPNWASPVTERLTWVTDAMESFNGKGQFVQLREYPKQEWNFLVDVDERRARTIENAIYNWNGRVWALPVWPDIEVLVSTVNAGSSSVSVPNTSNKSYAVGGLAMFISADGNSYETAEIEAVDTSSIDFARPLANTWGPGSKVYPVVFCRMPIGQTLSRFTHRDSYGNVSFSSVRGVPYATLSEASYRSYPVLDRMPEWNVDPSIAIQDKISLMENPVGEGVFERESEVARVFYSWKWQALDREEIDFIKKFLYARRGRARAVWVPTYAEDLKPTSVISSASTTFTVEHAGLVQFLSSNSVHRRDIRIHLKNGAVYYRRINNFESVSSAEESVSIDSPLGVDVALGDVYRVSWMMLMRLDSDTTEFAWDTPQIASTNLTMRGYNNDV